MATATKSKETKREPREKTVHVIRKEKNSHLPNEVLQDSTVRIGSIFDGRSPLKGLEGEEERELLSGLLGIEEDHPEFRERARKFWAEMSLTVDTGGETLNISIDESGNPENVEDYITYKWLREHKYVADSKEEMLSSPLKDFYIRDPERETKKENERVNAKKDAYREFIHLTEGKEAKMDMVLRILDSTNPSKLTREQKENKLETYAAETPKKFTKIATDENLEIRSEIDEMVENEIIRKSGNSYFYMDELIGENLQETIGYFQNKKNSSTVNDMRAKLKELK